MEESFSPTSWTSVSYAEQTPWCAAAWIWNARTRPRAVTRVSRRNICFTGMQLRNHYDGALPVWEAVSLRHDQARTWLGET